MSQPIVHFDIFGPEESLLHRFYGDLLGWSIDKKGPGYALVETSPDGLRGAIVEQEVRSVTLGVVVNNLEEAVTKRSA